VLEASVDVHVFLYANVIELRSNREGNRIESVDAVALDGTARRIRARWYVLAAGAIENARLLLASNRVEAHGIGNRHDLVGRFFMEHPRATVGEVWSRQGRKLLETYDYCPFGKTDVLPGIATSPRLTQEKRILSGCMTLLDEVGPGQSMRATSALDFEDLLQVRRDLEPPAPEPPPRRASRPDQSESTGIWIVVRSEQAPSPDSRITLSQERDAAGQRRVRLDLRFSPQDKRTLRVMAETLGAELGRLGMGRVWLAEVFRRSDDDWSGVPGLRVGFHHMGTTRMADDPRKGVVDADCRVHGIANLYVTGSSVFVTGGWANPTLTVVALALRLAEHLKRIAS